MGVKGKIEGVFLLLEAYSYTWLGFGWQTSSTRGFEHGWWRTWGFSINKNVKSTEALPNDTAVKPWGITTICKFNPWFRNKN